MGGKGGGDSAPMMYAAQGEPVGHADPIDLSSKQQYINAQKAAQDATAKDPVPTDTPTQGDDAKTPGDTAANTVLAPPNFWFNQPVSTLQPVTGKKSGSMKIYDDRGSV
jgi:hypothetical protein